MGTKCHWKMFENLAQSSVKMAHIWNSIYHENKLIWWPHLRPLKKILIGLLNQQCDPFGNFTVVIIAMTTVWWQYLGFGLANRSDCYLSQPQHTRKVNLFSTADPATNDRTQNRMYDNFVARNVIFWAKVIGTNTDMKIGLKSMIVAKIGTLLYIAIKMEIRSHRIEVRLHNKRC